MLKSINTHKFLGSTVEDRSKRLNILVDMIFSHHKYLGGSTYHTRMSDIILFKDMIKIGEDKTPGIKRHNEHVVPLAYLLDKAFQIMREEKNDDIKREQLFYIFDRCLMTVVTNKDKADLLDSRLNGGLNLKTSMPKNWDIFTDDPLIRIKMVYKDDFDLIEFYS